MTKIERIATMLAVPWIEHHKKLVHPRDFSKEHPFDPGYAIFVPLPGWARERAERIIAQGIESVPDYGGTRTAIASILESPDA